jgi:hypothetical protein
LPAYNVIHILSDDELPLSCHLQWVAHCIHPVTGGCVVSSAGGQTQRASRLSAVIALSGDTLVLLSVEGQQAAAELAQQQCNLNAACQQHSELCPPATLNQHFL